MIRKLQKTDYIFLGVLLLCLLFHSIFLFTPPFLMDEAFYVTIPYRLVKGDSLIRHEWHLSQFSSLFSYLPVLFWRKVQGSADGIFLFLRCFYLSVHTAAASVIYRFFRKYGPWAIAAAVMYYMHIPYRIYAVSYSSMFALFLLLLTLCLLCIHSRPTPKLYLLSGLCYSACCVNNPLLCLAFVPYPVFCLAGGKKASSSPQQPASPFRCFFTREALGYFSFGICIAAAICLVFFFATGGTLSSVPPNIKNLLRSSEYNIASLSLGKKFTNTLTSFRSISFGLPLLPGLAAALLLDKKRKQNSHRLVYLALSLLLCLVFICGIVRTAVYSLDTHIATVYSFSLPFFVFSTVCYVLTERKNKSLFSCMWCPCAVAALFQLLASNSLLSSLGVVFAVSNVAGVLFTRDLFQELFLPSREAASSRQTDRIPITCRRLLCAALCLQLLFYGFVLLFGQLPTGNRIRASTGPMAGLVLSEPEHQSYTISLQDLDIVAERSGPEDPVYIHSDRSWMYLYLDRPIAIHHTWFQGRFLGENLLEYYRCNPEKVPKYIYMDQNVFSVWVRDSLLTIAGEWFDFTVEDLPGGILLTVHASKLS